MVWKKKEENYSFFYGGKEKNAKRMKSSSASYRRGEEGEIFYSTSREERKSVKGGEGKGSCFSEKRRGVPLSFKGRGRRKVRKGGE